MAILRIIIRMLYMVLKSLKMQLDIVMSPACHSNSPYSPSINFFQKRSGCKLIKQSVPGGLFFGDFSTTHMTVIVQQV